MMAAAKTKLFSFQTKRNRQYAWRIVYSVFLLLLAACGPVAQDEPLFIPPAPIASPLPAATTISLWTPTPETGAEAPLAIEVTQTLTPQASPTVSETPTESCNNDLKFLADLTIPDGSLVNAGERIDKQWRVINSGSCDWDGGYRLKLVEGFPPLGAEINQALFPARSGAEVTIQVIFIAPSSSGVYRSAWQAYTPNGAPFGETIYIEINIP